LIAANLLTLAAWTVVAALVAAGAYALVVVEAALRVGGRREDFADSADAVSASRLTIPVSLVLPVTATTRVLRESISSALGLNYPELELILVADSLTPEQIQLLSDEWEIEARELFYRRTLPTADVKRIYRSARDPRLVVIGKDPAGYADAINCWINVSRYRYVAVLDPAVEFDAGALLRLMSTPMSDPGRIIGATNHIEGRGAFSRLAAARAFAISRLHRRSRGALGAYPAASVWRRDALLKEGGYSPTAVNPQLDLMFRMQANNGASGRVVRDSHVFGSVRQGAGRGSSTFAASHRGAAALVLKSLRSGSGELPFRIFARFLNREVLVPAACAWILGVLVVAAALGHVAWTFPLLALIALSFGAAAVSAASLLLRGAAPDAPDSGQLKRLLLLAPFEPLLARISRSH
jgi:cellulose synthase/poly-beta-1,6-N-acetylglucosamine synthase-like glycosyltransferase